MKLSHQKLKMMYLAKILMGQTDEERTITDLEIIAELSKDVFMNTVMNKKVSGKISLGV